MPEPRYIKRGDVIAEAHDDGTEASRAAMFEVLREAIRQRRRIEIDYDGTRRAIEPHRVWQRADGERFLEAFQVEGESEWPRNDDPDAGPIQLELFGDEHEPACDDEGGDEPDTEDDQPEPKRRGIRGWLSFLWRKARMVSAASSAFDARPTFNPDPARRLGRIESQVPGPARDPAA